MKIINITESGALNALQFAIRHKMKLQTSHSSFVNIINDEMCYIVELADINFFELFRLTQLYRNKLKIIDENIIPIDLDHIKSVFIGKSIIDNTKDINEDNYKIALSSLELFSNLIDQMSIDEDMISPGSIKMFLPMFLRRYTIQFPISFYDVLSSINHDNYDKVFNENYPNSLSSFIENDHNDIYNMIYIGIVKSTEPLKYNQSYSKAVDAFKYFPIKKFKDEISGVGLSGFWKKDPLSRNVIRGSIVQSNPEVLSNTMKTLKNINAPLEIEVAVQMPIHHMQTMLYEFDNDILDISYESSIHNIMANGIKFNDFNEYAPTMYNEDDTSGIEIYTENIMAYKVRIAECEVKVLRSIKLIYDSNADISFSDIFSLLPAGNKTNCIIKFNTANKDKLKSSYPFIQKILDDIITLCKNIENEINSIK